MKVLYNITPLGIMHFKSGCFRVTESLAEQLALRTDIDLKFCSNSILSSFKALDYTTGKQSLPAAQYSIPRLSKTTRKIVGIHADLADTINKKETGSIKRFALRSERKLFKVLAQKIYNVSGDNIFLDAVDLKTASIYHSTSDPIPKVVGSNKKIKSFFTSYDIIPVLFPEMYGDFLNYFNSMLDNLNKDTWVLCISHSCRNDLLNYMGNKIDPEKVLVTQLAAGDIFYQSSDENLNRITREKYGIPECPYVLSVCTLDRRKNIGAVIKAFSEMINQEHINDLKLVLVGEKGSMYENILEEIGHHDGLKDKIIITGSVPDEDLAHLYSQAMMFVYPSLYEGFGLPPLEAMQCGTPVITSNTSSLPEVVGDAGIMIAPGDINALADAMLRLYRDAAFREQLTEKSLSRAKLFSWKKCADDTVKAYKTSMES